MKPYEGSFWLNNNQVNLPVTFDIDDDIVSSVEKPLHDSELFNFTLKNQRRRILTIKDTDSDFLKKAVREISQQ